MGQFLQSLIISVIFINFNIEIYNHNRKKKFKIFIKIVCLRLVKKNKLQPKFFFFKLVFVNYFRCNSQKTYF